MDEHENNNNEDFGEFPFDLPGADKETVVRMYFDIDGELPIGMSIKVPASLAPTVRKMLTARVITELAFLCGKENETGMFDPESKYLEIENAFSREDRKKRMGLV
jgi:hypothetical protein